MKLHLQFGYGMMNHCRTLITEWGGGTVILSPRDLDSKQLLKLSNTINRLQGGEVMVDPQFYLPHADYARLISHSYWPTNYSTGTFFAGSQLSKLIYDLKLLNDALNTCEAILPCVLASQISDDWLSAQLMIFEEARAINFNRPICQTIAISADACRDDSQVEKLLEHTAQHRADSYYLVCEHPRGNYLVDDASWLANVLDIVAGLKLNGAKVRLGYCSHQMLIAGVVKADAIASGTWMNVRSFPPEKFRASYEEEIRQRAVWYYCPQSLSEYKLPYLDIARKLELLDLLAPTTTNMDIQILFSGGQPSTIGLGESEAFQHYLTSLKRQVDGVVKESFDETIEAYEDFLGKAQGLLGILSTNKIVGQMRDFTEIIDVNKAALEVIKTTRAPMLRRNWSQL